MKRVMSWADDVGRSTDVAGARDAGGAGVDGAVVAGEVAAGEADAPAMALDGLTGPDGFVVSR